MLSFYFVFRSRKKMHFTISANQVNPNLNLDCTDYADFCLCSTPSMLL